MTQGLAPSQLRKRQQSLVLHGVSLEVIEDLEKRMSKPIQDEHGNLDWVVPDWLKLMRETARK